MEKSVQANPPVYIPPLRDPLGLWKDDGGSAWVKRIHPAILFSVSGECTRRRMIDLCSSIAGRWNPNIERLVLDFADVKKSDDDGGRFIACQLSRLVCETQGSICVVRVPLEARALFKRYLGGEDIRLAYQLVEAILS